MLIVQLQLGIQEVRLVLLFPHVLEADKTNDYRPQKSEQYQKQTLVIGKFNHGSHNQNLNVLQYKYRMLKSWNVHG